MTWERCNGGLRRSLMEGDGFANEVDELVLGRGDHDLLAGQSHVCGYYVVSGELTLDGRTVGPDTLLWIVAGRSLPAEAKTTVHVVRIVTGVALVDDDASYQLFVEPELPWSRPPADGMTASRHMVRAEDWGVKIQTCIYTRAFKHAWHSHAHAHGIYVLEGVVRNDFESGQDAFFGPGEFALTPAGQEVLHEPASPEVPVRYLFVGDGPFDFIVDGKDLYNQ